jgi:hypothetical protein
MEGYREVMPAPGDGSRAIIPTEFGWAESGSPQPGYGVTAPGTELAGFGILNTPAYHVLAGLPK